MEVHKVKINFIHTLKQVVVTQKLSREIEKWRERGVQLKACEIEAGKLKKSDLNSRKGNPEIALHE